MNKQITTGQILQIFKDNQTIMVGGFGIVGSPLTLIDLLSKSEAKNLTIISNNLGEQGKGLGKLVINKQVRKGIGSYFTTNKDVVEAYNKNELEIKLLPQGTMAESIRAGGAGIGGFYVKTSTGTSLSKNSEIRNIDGIDYVFQKPLNADIALIKAKKSDKLGNLIYNKSARNFNPIMATAADIVIAEVEEIDNENYLSPEEIVTPHIFIDYVIESKGVE
ncbi:CoA transferase subunit A [Virgibacillus byunsanensis]|uniref:CoA transferase subunit A n=1 Tax=Virgibacillus byunsanensis TaxID=570945 RepID=A0ABW3LMS7_9BACI